MLQFLRPSPTPGGAAPGSSIPASRQPSGSDPTAGGATEIGWGTALLCFALSSYTFVLFPAASPWRDGLGWLLLACGGLAPYGIQQLFKIWLPRPPTEAAANRRVTRGFILTMIFVAIVAAGVGTALALLGRRGGHLLGTGYQGEPEEASASGLPFLLAALLAVPNAILYLMFAAATLRKHRWKWLFLALILLAPFALAPAAPGGRSAPLRPAMLALGLLWFVSGGITLISFLRHPPAAVATTADRPGIAGR